jgi:hypothetical protein
VTMTQERLPHARRAPRRRDRSHGQAAGGEVIPLQRGRITVSFRARSRTNLRCYGIVKRIDRQAAAPARRDLPERLSLGGRASQRTARCSRGRYAGVFGRDFPLCSIPRLQRTVQGRRWMVKPMWQRQRGCAGVRPPR